MLRNFAFALSISFALTLPLRAAAPASTAAVAELRQQRIAALQQIVDIESRQYAAGRATASDLAGDRARLLLVRSQGASDPQRAALLSQRVDLLKQSERLVQARHDAGMAGPSDLAAARYDTLDAEIDLATATGQPAPDVLQARATAARNACDETVAEASRGQRPFTTTLQWLRRLASSEQAAAGTPGQVTAARTQSLLRARQCEARAQTLFDAGRLSHVDVLMAQQARIEAELKADPAAAVQRLDEIARTTTSALAELDRAYAAGRLSAADVCDARLQLFATSIFAAGSAGRDDRIAPLLREQLATAKRAEAVATNRVQSGLASPADAPRATEYRLQIEIALAELARK